MTPRHQKAKPRVLKAGMATANRFSSLWTHSEPSRILVAQEIQWSDREFGTEFHRLVVALRTGRTGGRNRFKATSTNVVPPAFLKRSYEFGGPQNRLVILQNARSIALRMTD